jgi:hypothetical protein
MAAFSEKLALMAGAGALATAPAVAPAALVTKTGAPLSVSFLDAPAVTFSTASVAWDVDGVNGADFSLFGLNTYASTDVSGAAKLDYRYGFNLIAPYSKLVSAAPEVPLNGIGFAANTSAGVPGLAAVPSSAVLGPDLGSYTAAIGIANAAGVLRVFSGAFLISQSTYFSGYVAGAPGSFNIGFSFLSSGATHYGWANISVENGPEWRLTVNEWTYDDTPGSPVHVPDQAAVVPAPPAGVAALTLLALGAAGVRRWRNKSVIETDSRMTDDELTADREHTKR